MPGYGFYQLSPELFFNVYSSERGFSNTEIFLVEVSNPENWYKCENPKEMKARLCVETKGEVYIVSITKKIKKILRV